VDAGTVSPVLADRWLQHLRVLRDRGFASVRAEGTRRFYAVEAAPLREIDAWLDRFRRFWDRRLDALDTELAAGRRARQDRSTHREDMT
jgi:sugar-specific transcriptional regulator TrmB